MDYRSTRGSLVFDCPGDRTRINGLNLATKRDFLMLWAAKLCDKFSFSGSLQTEAQRSPPRCSSESCPAQKDKPGESKVPSMVSTMKYLHNLYLVSEIFWDRGVCELSPAHYNGFYSTYQIIYHSTYQIIQGGFLQRNNGLLNSGLWAASELYLRWDYGLLVVNWCGRGS